MGLNAVPLLQPAADAQSALLTLDNQEWNRCAALEGAAPAQNFSTEDRAEAEKRFGIIEALVFPERFPEIWRQCGGRKLGVVHYLAAEHSCSARTIRHWVTRYGRYSVQGLVNKDRSDKGTHRKRNKAASELILTLAIPKRGVFGTLTVNEMWRAYMEEHAWREERIGQPLSQADSQKYARYLEDGRLSEGARLPQMSCKTLRACVAEIPEAVRTLARDGEEAYRNTQEILSHRDLSEIEPLEFLVMDHRILDIFCRVPIRGGWRLARPWLSAGIDMRTRRFLGWGLFEVPSSDAIATVLRKVFIEHGVPRNAYIDNGADYRCEYLEGKHVRREQTGPLGELDATWRGVFGTLGVRVIHAIVRNARAKIIEPNFIRIANFDKQLPEYCGHRPSERPERLDLMVKQHEAWLRSERPESPFRTISEIAALYDAAIADLNERPLQGEGMQKFTPNGRGWMSPGECWDKLIPRVERRTVRVEDLHVVFTRRRTLTVKHGEICATFGGQKFHYRLEGEPTQLMVLNGQLVELAFDPHDLGQAACYWRDRFVGLANCIPLRKMGDDSFVEDERNRRAARRDIKRAVESIHNTIPVAGPEERLARRREVLPQRSIGGVGVPVELPAAVVEAEAAMRAAREFRFAEATAEVPIGRIEMPVDEDAGDTFNFFSDGGAE
jgi:hypothetical protein